MNTINELCMQNSTTDITLIQSGLEKSWKKIAPCWPLENIIAVNPLGGFQDLHFQEALQTASFYFQTKNISDEIKNINIQTIKWLQLFFDEKQAAIKMPLKDKGLVRSVYQLIQFDSEIINKNTQNFNAILQQKISLNNYEIIQECLNYLNISQDNYEQYFTLLLTALPGWASYIQYKSSQESCSTLLQQEYIALRLILTCFIYPQGKNLVTMYQNTQLLETEITKTLEKITEHEKEYHNNLFTKLKQSQFLSHDSNTVITSTIPQAQMIFCIDVRSEGIRKTIEELGDYQTYGFAGFFGLPIKIHDINNTKEYASCPVLLCPKYTVTLSEKIQSTHQQFLSKKTFTKIYQSLKYTVLTPFGLAESTGLISGIVIILKTLLPKFFYSIKNRIYSKESISNKTVNFESIPLEEQCTYALQTLQSIGLVNKFSSLIFFIAHASQTENNAYASALDCGACAGRKGGLNAFVLAKILNKNEVRTYLQNNNILIPDTTYFIAAEHITTTDAINIITQDIPVHLQTELQDIKKAFDQAQEKYSKIRTKNLNLFKISKSDTTTKSQDWAEIRPEWGLAKNGSFIIGPRALTQENSLDGRSFLHSYDWNLDTNGTILTGILNGPMIVGQWINAQYLFSTIDNTAFGAGSKITHNVTGKIGVMQGNGSDLMNGLPLQSVYITDTKPYHQPIRLSVIVYAPLELLEKIVQASPLLEKLIKNEWIYITCINPSDKSFNSLTPNLTWEK